MSDFLDHWAQSDQAHAKLVGQEALIAQVTEEISAAIERMGINRSELAGRMHASKGYVSQLLGGSRNMTLRTLADLCQALDLRPRFTLDPTPKISEPS